MACVYAAYLGLFVVALCYVQYRGFVADLRDTRNVPESDELPTGRHVDRALAARLGSVLHLRGEKRSAFTRFPREKAAGVVRVCAFGDSFTFGNEVDGDHDYPTLLQREFARLGLANVEVLNFGNGGYGFHQSYLLWDAVGSGFACDFALLGPSGFQASRDTTFNHLQGRSPFYLHARYVLDGGDVRLVDPIGDRHEERFAHYYRFVPHARYLRYDRVAPACLQAFVHRDDWEMRNPFYYRDGPIEDEAHETYRILLAKMAECGVQLVLGHYWGEIVALGMDVPAENLAVVSLYRPRRLPYLAPKGHNSAWGNALLARMLLGVLVEGRAPPPTLLETGDPEPAGGACPGEPPRLDAFDRASLVLGDAVVGHFAIAKGFRGWGRGSPRSLHRRRVASLLALVAPGAPAVGALFAPLGAPLREGARVSLALSGGGASREVPLPPIRRLHPCANVGVLTLPGLDRDVFRGNDAVSAADLASPDVRLRVLVDGTPLLAGRGGGPVSLRPPGRHRLWKLTQNGSAPDAVPTSGHFALRFEGGGAGPLRFPIAVFREVPAEVPEVRRAPRLRIVRAADGRAALERR